MEESVLSTAVAGAMLATSSVATAQDPSPELTLAEKSAFTCIEQALSLVAALIDRVGPVAVGNRMIAVKTSAFKSAVGDEAGAAAVCTIDDTTITVTTTADTLRGTSQVTAIPIPGEIDDVYFFNLAGEFWYSREGEIMYADADFQLCVNNCGPGFPGAENYDEHVIKDFYADPDALPVRFVLDQSLEVITKNNWPRIKFRQTSNYTPPDGGIGFLSIDKVAVAPDNAPDWLIQLEGQVDDFGGEIQFSGKIGVFPL